MNLGYSDAKEVLENKIEVLLSDDDNRKDIFSNVENCYEEKTPYRTNIFSENKIKCPIYGSGNTIKKLKNF